MNKFENIEMIIDMTDDYQSTEVYTDKNPVYKYCIKNSIKYTAGSDPMLVDHVPDKTMIIVVNDKLSTEEVILDWYRTGYHIGVIRYELRHMFQGLPEYGPQLEQIICGILNLKTGQVVQIIVPDTYDEERKAWVAEHSGTRTCSCGTVLMTDSDFSHGCGENTCYMCS